jgi:hypothetical protein
MHVFPLAFVSPHTIFLGKGWYGKGLGGLCLIMSVAIGKSF